MVRRIPSSQNNVLKTSRILVNGKKCAVYNCSRPHQTTNDSRSPFYWHTCIGSVVVEDGCDILILVCRNGNFPARYFIIPDHVFLDGGDARQRDVYIPVRGYSHYRGRKPKVDYCRYENSWYLFIEGNRDTQREELVSQ